TEAGVLTSTPSHDDAWCVDDSVGPAECRDHAIAPGASWSQIDEQNLIFTLMNNLAQFGSQPHQIASRQPALKDGKLNVIAPIAHRLEYIPQPLRIGDVVTNNVGVAHRHTV